MGKPSTQYRGGGAVEAERRGAAAAGHHGGERKTSAARAAVPETRTPKPALALPRGVQAVLVTSSQLRNIYPQLHVPPLLLANTLIAAFTRVALPRLDIPLLRHIVRRAHPFRPDAFTFPPLIRAAPAHSSVVQLHACALRRNGLANEAIEAYSRMQKHEGLKLGYVEPSLRPDDSRYDDNPNRLRRQPVPDPKELKRQRNREYYARNKDDILKRRREARDKKAASTAVVTDQQNETNTSVPMSVDPKELRRQRDRERYARNRDEILKRQRISREKRKTASQLLNDASTVSLTPTKGQTGVTELQRLTYDVTGLSSMQNSSHARVPDNPQINLTNEEDSNWLHRNDAYQRRQRNGCSEIAIDVPLGRLIQPTSSIIRDISEGEDEDDDPYGIFEPDVEHTSLQG
ncbi:hypothetical protein ZWY2020_051882 [Hordeum vulgare]|nr:hypothetical protein ZWY2020_051882 [Hordeum vulgare]